MAKPTSLQQRVKRWLTAPLVLLAALLIFIEECLWDQLAALFGLLAKLPLWGRLERWISRLPAWAALPAFLVPMVLLFPIKLAALWLMAHHHVILGLQVILAAKVGGTAVAARLFMLLKPTLLTVPWFARIYTTFVSWRARIFTRLHEMVWWQTAQHYIAYLRQKLASWRGNKGSWYRLVQKVRRWRLKKARR